MSTHIIFKVFAFERRYLSLTRHSVAYHARKSIDADGVLCRAALAVAHNPPGCSVDCQAWRGWTHLRLDEGSVSRVSLHRVSAYVGADGRMQLAFQTADSLFKAHE